VMTVAGSDTGGGAGVQADLLSFARLGCWGTSAITCLTAQNPDGVSRVEPVAPEMVAEQIRMIASRLPLRAVKIGMTYSGPVVESIADALARHAGGAPVVLDPVMRALRDFAAMEEAARRIQAKTRGAVLVKGGHLPGPSGDASQAVDVLLAGGRLTRIAGERVVTPFAHGTGCSLSAAIAAAIACGDDLEAAVRRAKAYVADLLRDAVQLGDERLGGLGFVPPAGRR
jgi:hydroxymethylpyrimidine/phosphomethylpyrimidine kinase